MAMQFRCPGQRVGRALAVLVVGACIGSALAAYGIFPQASSTPTPNQSSSHVKEFAIPTANSTPGAITAGPDGNLWFTETAGDKIGRITPQGDMMEFPVPTQASVPDGITAGPDGNLWFTESDGNKIGSITPQGTITEFAVPTAASAPEDITAGPDGNLWFAERNTNSIGCFPPGA